MRRDYVTATIVVLSDRTPVSLFDDVVRLGGADHQVSITSDSPRAFDRLAEILADAATILRGRLRNDAQSAAFDG